MEFATVKQVAQLASAIDTLSNKLEQIQKHLPKPNRSADTEYFAQIYLDDRNAFDRIRVTDWSDFERPFDNVRVIFDAETENLKYIGLIDDLPF